jgi:hypothetical protein
MTVCPSVRKTQVENDWMDFDKIWYWVVFLKLVALQFWFTSNNSNGHFTWRSTCVSARRTDWMGNPETIVITVVAWGISSHPDNYKLYWDDLCTHLGEHLPIQRFLIFAREAWRMLLFCLHFRRYVNNRNRRWDTNSVYAARNLFYWIIYYVLHPHILRLGSPEYEASVLTVRPRRLASGFEWTSRL